MRNEEVVRKNISLVFDFLRYLTENPELMEKMPDQCELEFLEKDVPLFESGSSVKVVDRAFLKVEHTFHAVNSES